MAENMKAQGPGVVTRGVVKPPKLAEIAARIYAHLSRMEKAQARLKDGEHVEYSYAGAWAAGNRVAVRYVSYNGSTNLTKSDALEYLAWLDAGNEGKHYAVLGFNARVRIAEAARG